VYFTPISKTHLRFYGMGFLCTTMQRYLKKHLVEDLSRKMVFLGGARQVGKTTLVLSKMNEVGFI